MDVMNVLHYRGNTGDRGTSLLHIVAGKIRTILRLWMTGPRAQHLHQIHLHIDDPSRLITHKVAEQSLRDAGRSKFNSGTGDEGHDMSTTVNRLHSLVNLNVLWSTLLSDKSYKDELATLHLFCSAVALFDVVSEPYDKTHLKPCVYLHRGTFSLQGDFRNCSPKDYVPIRHALDCDDNPKRFRNN